MGAPAGNANAAKSRLFYDALRKNLVQNPHRVQLIVENLISAAEENEQWAIKELMDRFGGVFPGLCRKLSHFSAS